MDHLWPVAVLACLFAFVSTHPIRPQDFWWHLAIGHRIGQTHQIPQVDAYSYTAPGAAYPAYNVYWLSELALYRVYSAGGPALSLLVHALLITGTYLVLFLLSRRLSRSGRLGALAVMLAAACGFENWNLRPQAISYLLFVLMLSLIYAYRTNVRTPQWLVFAFPLLMGVWVNCHGSFPLGLVLLGIWLVETAWERFHLGERCRREVWLPATALGLSIFATFANPQGGAIYGYLAEMSKHPVVRRLPEWAPASLSTSDGLAFFVLAAAGLLLLLVAGRSRSGLFHWLLFGAFALLAWRTGRAIIWFGLVLAPIVAEMLPQLLPAREAPPPSRSDRVVIGALMAFFLGLVLISLPWFKHRLPFPEQKAGLISAETPLAATQYLLAHNLRPHVFHDMSYGSYLIWLAETNPSAAGRLRVFADPRIELYHPRLWDVYHSISDGEGGWEDYLVFYDVNTLLLDRQLQAGLARAAAASPRWEQVYQDRRAVIFVRRGG